MKMSFIFIKRHADYRWLSKLSRGAFTPDAANVPPGLGAAYRLSGVLWRVAPASDQALVPERRREVETRPLVIDQ
jgi:hypothetical protein